MRAVSILLCVMCLPASVAAQSAETGRKAYAGRCAGCHGTNGNGGELGPGIATRVPARTDDDLSSLIRQGLPTAGMPAFPNLADAEVRDLIAFLRTLKPREGGRPCARK